MRHVLSWQVRLLFVIAAFIAGLLLPYPRIAQFGKFVPLTVLIVLVTILLFVIDLIRESPTLSNLKWTRPIISGVTTLAAIASVFKGTAELRTLIFDPIRQASGIGFIHFDRLIDPWEFSFRSWSPGVPPIEILGAIRGGPPLGSFSITSIDQTTDRSNVNGVDILQNVNGVVTVQRHTVIRFTFSSDPILFPNRLENVSAKRFTSMCNNLEILLGFMPEDVTYDGVVNLTLNGDQFHRFVIPKAYPSHLPSFIVVPLNERARQEMMKYKLWNPTGGTLDYVEHVPEPTPGNFGTWPP